MRRIKVCGASADSNLGKVKGPSCSPDEELKQLVDGRSILEEFQDAEVPIENKLDEKVLKTLVVCAGCVHTWVVLV